MRPSGRAFLGVRTALGRSSDNRWLAKIVLISDPMSQLSLPFVGNGVAAIWLYRLSSVLRRSIEDYPEDQRGQSCLMHGQGEGDRPIHVVCSPKDEYLAIITAYLPSELEWTEDFQTRKTK